MDIWEAELLFSLTEWIRPPTGIATSICSWSDITGFGTACAESNWDLEVLSDKRLFQALQTVWYQAAKQGWRLYQRTGGSTEETVLPINDGVVVSVDAPPPELVLPSALGGYLHVRAKSHKIFSTIARAVGLPGAITVLSYGQRFLFPPEEGQAAATPVTGAFNMNTAFAFAYLIESSGRKWGARPGQLYVTDELMSYVRAVADDWEEAPDGAERTVHFNLWDGPESPLPCTDMRFALDIARVETKVYATTLHALRRSNCYQEVLGDDKLSILPENGASGL